MKRSDLGFLKLPEQSAGWSESENYAKTLRSKFDTLVVVGVGGSALGTRAIRSYLSFPRPHVRVEIWDTLDPRFLQNAVARLPDLSTTHFVFVSKSGSTLETLTLAQWIHQLLRKRGYRLDRQATVITENTENLLRQWALRSQIETLFIPVDVGGRFSVLTPAALLPAAFAGVSLGDLREGARSALQSGALIENIAGQALASWSRQEWITYFWYYSDLFFDLGRWTQQLWAESLAKNKNRHQQSAPRVSTPLIGIGPADQHSMLQQMVEGHRDKWVWLIDSAPLNEEPMTADLFEHPLPSAGQTLSEMQKILARSTRMALDEGGVSVLHAAMNDVSAKSLGFYFMLLECIVGVLGEALDINAYDQPGVERSKQIARELLGT